MEQKIKDILNQIIHPETSKGLVDSGFVESITVEDKKLQVVLNFHKARDPFMGKMRQRAIEELQQKIHDRSIIVNISQPEKKEDKNLTTTGAIGKVIAVASGKGGVGKSTVTANLAVTLSRLGLRVGILDADIYGPSQPMMFSCSDYMPDAYKDDETGIDTIVPFKTDEGIKIMSIGFFIRPDDALMWRGAMATNALKQLIHQTKWDELDVLLLDMPPGTGDIHLSIINELKLDGAVIISTPQQVAIADVRRSAEMFLHEQVNIPVLGLIENMAYFTPKELPDNKYYIFGKGGAKQYAEENDLEFLGEIPIIQSIMDCGDKGTPASVTETEVEKIYEQIALKIVKKLS